MRCPYCRHPDSRVVDSREQDEGQVIRRRRCCPECGRRFTTVEEATLAVIKRSGVTEPFSRDQGHQRCPAGLPGRPVDEDRWRCSRRPSRTRSGRGWAEVPSDEVGLAILGPLRQLDEVAYLRFASVYQAFSSLERLREGHRRPARGDGRPAPPGRADRRAHRPAPIDRQHRPRRGTLRP